MNAIFAGRRLKGRLAVKNVWTNAVAFTCMMVVAAFGFSTMVFGAGRLPPDQPQYLGDAEVVCTGIGLDARLDPRWESYPLKIELTGRGGQFLGEATVKVSRAGRLIADIACDGPWVMLRVPPGRYQVSATTEGVTMDTFATVPLQGQGRVVLRFPELGGQISPERQTPRGPGATF